MALSLFTKTKKAIIERAQDDYATKMRLKYKPYYHAMEAQSGTRIKLQGRDMVMLSSNDYLGLSFHPKVIEACGQGPKIWGTSTTGARISNGSRAYHVELEEKLAAFLGREACHISVAGYISCCSAVATFAQKGDLILADKNIHSCLWDGIRLSMATAERFSHNNPEDLRQALKGVPHSQPKMLVIEGVYSMEGHICRLPELASIGEEAGCFTVLDDAHGFGVLGRQGRGTVDHFKLNDKVDLLCGSMSKSLASTGGFVAGSRELIEYLRTNSKQTIFSAAISPSMAAAASASLDILQTEPQHLERLWRNTKRYREMLKGLGLDTWGSETPAVPIVLGSKELVYRFWNALLDKGVFTVMSIAPAVPPGKDLIRTAVSALHSDEDLEKIAAAMAHAVKQM
ncbi:aminotransferase class I/II-fold pyridoxal phosphate-dependent enzyme [Opitutus sp. GAS368]|jgi:8-amino-7-oxononanoate synthase|uniref:aminotransferase class I/II-fold pyridoxal phosphate-dependent enzyme n=1 Tax=Opitutus sp. GAS368 TaxID=1882749 RepID=UPI00087AD28E|nr:aminotransferase class I/II-fold pyridoxal phosphate-dependent enzyme [Opitutus sp. GAS368]SDS24423.1 7-keto-8-aminopelargonate synthetase [Opitutus sp. GAS368]